MIWTENHGQVPSGSQVTTVTLDGRSRVVWRSATYIAFVVDYGAELVSTNPSWLTFEGSCVTRRADLLVL